MSSNAAFTRALPLSFLACSFLIPLTACNQLSEEPVAQLENLVISNTSAPAEASDSESWETSATLAASGDLASGDWTLAAGDALLTLHSPGHSDLSALNELDATMRLGTADTLYENRGVAVSDAQGVVYLAESVDGGVVAPELFGSSFATYGTVLGEGEQNDYKLTFYTVAFETDDGVMEVAPGEPAALTIQGAEYRAVVVAAYTAETVEGGTYADCGGMADMLSYELLRTDAPDLEAVSRPDGMEKAGAGCGAD